MRVIAGEFKGRRVEPVPGDGTRPTTDMVREAFASSVISSRPDGFEGASVLDAFAGSGAVGIEALSRGAVSCTFVEQDPKAVAVIEANIKPLPLGPGQAVVRRADAFSLPVPNARGTVAPVAGAPFDIVFLDPPYEVAAQRVCELVNQMAASGTLSEGALVAYQRGCKKPRRQKGIKKKDAGLPQDVVEILDGFNPEFELVNVRTYGTTQIIYLRFSAGE